jgi:hypothetical protein
LALSHSGFVDVREASLPDGSDPESGTGEVRGSFLILHAGEGLTLSVGAAPVDLESLAAGVEQKFESATGILILKGWYPDTGEVQYSYTLSDPLSHDDPALGTPGNHILPGDAFRISVTDSRGNIVSDTLAVRVIDDAPTALPDYVEITADTLADLAVPSDTHSLLTNEHSADGITLVGLDPAQGDNNITSVSDNGNGSFDVATLYGIFRIAADGKYTFDPGSDFETLSGPAEITFSYTIRDGDGDLSHARVTLDMYRQDPDDQNRPPEIRSTAFTQHDTVTATGNLDGSYGMYSKTAALGDGGYVVAFRNGPNLLFSIYNAAGQAEVEDVVAANNAYVSTGGSSHFDYSDSFSLCSTPQGGFLITWDTTNHAGAEGSVYSSDGTPVSGLQNFNMAANDYRNGNYQSYNYGANSEYTDARDCIPLENGGFINLTHDNDGNYFNTCISPYNNNGTPANNTLNEGSILENVFLLDNLGGHSFAGDLAEIAPDKVVAVYMHSAGSGDTGTSSRIEGPAYADHYGTGTNAVIMNILDISRNTDGDISNVNVSAIITIAGSGHNKMPEVSALGDGRFVVVWQLESGADSDVMYRIYAQDGSSVTASLAAGGVESGAQYTPAVQALSDGGFVLAWAEMAGHDSGGADYDIVARRYAPDGTPLGEGPVRIAQGVEGYDSDGSLGSQRHPDITELADGRIVVSWTTMDGAQAGTAEVHHQLFTPDALIDDAGPGVHSYALIGGEEAILPLAKVLSAVIDPDAGLSSTSDAVPDSLRITLTDPRAGDFLSPDAAWCSLNGVQVSASADGSMLTFTLPDSVLDAAAQWALLTEAAQRVAFDSALPYTQVSGGVRTLHIRAADGKGSFSSEDVPFEVIARNDAPVVAPAGTDHADVLIGETVSLGEAGLDFRIRDTEMDDITQAQVRIDNYLQGRDFLQAIFPVEDPRFIDLSAFFDANTGALTISGAASAFVYQEALSFVTYTCASDTPIAEDRAFSLTVSDAEGLTPDSAPAHFSITVEHPFAPVLRHMEDPGEDMRFGPGTDPVIVALGDGGFAVFADAGGYLVLKCFDTNGHLRPGTETTIDGLDGITDAVRLADGGILLLGTQGGAQVSALVTADGKTLPVSSGLDEITDIAALPDGGRLLTGSLNGGMVCSLTNSAGVQTLIAVPGAGNGSFGLEAAPAVNSTSVGLLYQGTGGITAAFVDASGQSLGSVILNGAFADPSMAAILALDNGNFVVAWRSSDVPADVHTASEIVRCRVFDASGNAVGQDFSLDTVAYRTHDDLSLTDLGGGKFAVGWSVAGYGHNGAEASIWDTQGHSHGNMALSQGAAGSGQDNGTYVAALTDGGFVMAWQNGNETEYRVFNSDGSPRAANHYTSNQGPVSVFGDIDITDPDHSRIAQAVVTITSDASVWNDRLSLDGGFDPAAYGLTVTWQSGVLTISGEAHTSVYEAALHALRFSTSNDAPVGERVVGVVLTDADSWSSNTLNVPVEVHAAMRHDGMEGTLASDFITSGNWGSDLDINLGFGNDTIEFDAQHAQVSGGQGDDSIYGYSRAGADISGGDGNDTIIVEGYGNSAVVDGGSGNDVLYLNTYSGTNTVVGGAGDDIIHNNDYQGQAVYSWHAGDASAGHSAVDIINGYRLDHDAVDLSGLLDDLAGKEASDDLRKEFIEIGASPVNGKDLVINVHSAPGGDVVQKIVVTDAISPGGDAEDIIAQMQILLQSGNV